MRKLFFCVGMLIMSILVSAQIKSELKYKATGHPTPIQMDYLGSGTPTWTSADLNPSIITINHNNESENQEALEEYKQTLNSRKHSAAIEEIPTSSNKTHQTSSPVRVGGFDALTIQGTPSDNTVAINKNGQIILAVNSNLRTYNTSGTATSSATNLSYFFSTISNASLLSNNLCDPKVYYDAHADRFIVFAQTCDLIPSKSQILIAFSQTNNPTGAYNFYAFSGNPSFAIGQNVNFDYPKLGVSNHDLFITGNFFDDLGSYKQSGIYQIDKIKGYAGNTYVSGDVLLYTGSSSLGSNPFTLVPVPYGQDGTYGSEMYFVATKLDFGSSTALELFKISSYVQNSPQVSSTLVPTSSYAPPADGVQKSTSVLLSTGDSRGMDAIMVNGTIHFVFHCLGTNDYTEIYYVRLSYNNSTGWTSTSKRIANPNTDLAFPSIASMGWTNNDQSVLIGMDYSSKTQYPGIACVYVNHDMEVSALELLKQGTAPITTFVEPSTGATRWGDYSCCSRAFNETTPTVWVYGMFGNANNNFWSNNVSKVQTTSRPLQIANTTSNQTTNVFPNPVVEDMWNIKINTTEAAELDMVLLDISGKKIRDLYHAYVGIGQQVFSFNKGALPPGQYLIQIISNGKIINNEKIQVLH